VCASVFDGHDYTLDAALAETQQLIAVKKFADGLGGLEKLKGLIPKVEEMIAAFSAAA
jgi:hypothetical protein